MYEAPKFIKVALNIEESFTTYNCEYITDGASQWVFVADDCHEYESAGETSISGSVASFAPWECWLSPNA